MPVRFGPLLHQYRTAAGLTQIALARAVGVNSGYISRLEGGERAAPAIELVGAIATALALSPSQTDHLLAAAGYLPASLARVSIDDPTLALVIRLLADPAIPPEELRDFREIVRLLARRWTKD